ncbi:MAG: ABC transporter permease subunit [Actinobacteria bacterium]|nr:ABC transporter permease subunit [Actinomycetota bacterium]
MTATITPAAAVTVQPQTPWSTPRAKQLQSLGTLIVAGVVAGVVVLFTGVAGIDGWAVTFFGLSLVLAVVRTAKVGSKERTDQLMKVVVASAAVAAFTPWLSIFGSVILKGYVGVRPNYFTQDMSTTVPDDFLEFGGAIHAIVGSLLMVVIATVITLPLGIFIQSMSGVPSIVAGLFIYTTLVFATDTFSGMAGALALAVLMLPTVARTSEEVLKLVPEDLRSAGYALGARQWRTAFMVVIPTVRSGLTTAAILGIARVVGETAPLLLTSLSNSTLKLNPVDGPIASLPTYIFGYLQIGTEYAVARAWTGSLVLLFIVLVLFTLARRFGGKDKR